MFNIYGVRADLHIHSPLSPCGEMEMVPRKVLDRAVKKGLNMIAITDHNSALNVGAFMEEAYKNWKNLIGVIPGMELQSKEEVHIVALFETLEDLLCFQEFTDNYLPDVKNKAELFGEQAIIDSNGNLLIREERLLLNSLELSVSEIVNKINKFGGLSIAAHIDRPSYSLLSHLGFIPSNLNISALELSPISKPKEFTKAMDLAGYAILCSSDAHCLDDIGKAYSCFKGEPTFSSLKHAIETKKIKRVIVGGDRLILQ